jgi:hypothetical protein
MENSTEKVQETPKKQWVEPEMEQVVLERATTGMGADATAAAS